MCKTSTVCNAEEEDAEVNAVISGSNKCLSLERFRKDVGKKKTNEARLSLVH